MRRAARIDQSTDMNKPPDLSTRYGRYRARKRGLDVPKRKPGPRPLDFWSLVEKTDSCWLFRGPLNRDGYGKYQNGGTHMAHRWAWRLLVGEIPSGAILMHACDVENCVNPAHLSIGTHAENNHDKIRKGRQAKGEKTGNAILNSVAILDIRKNYRRQSRPGVADGNVKQLAAKYGVSTDAIWVVVKGVNWGHVA